MCSPNHTDANQLWNNQKVDPLEIHNDTRPREAAENKKGQNFYENPQLLCDVLKKSTVTDFPLLIGYDYLAKHLHKIGISITPSCALRLSHEKMDGSHLDVCPTITMGTSHYYQILEIQNVNGKKSNYFTIEPDQSTWLFYIRQQQTNYQ